MSNRFQAQQNARLALDKLRREIHCTSGVSPTAQLPRTSITITLGSYCPTREASSRRGASTTEGDAPYVAACRARLRLVSTGRYERWASNSSIRRTSRRPSVSTCAAPTLTGATKVKLARDYLTSSLRTSSSRLSTSSRFRPASPMVAVDGSVHSGSSCEGPPTRPPPRTCSASPAGSSAPSRRRRPALNATVTSPLATFKITQRAHVRLGPPGRRSARAT